MSWYHCTCGFVTEATPRFGDSIVSVSHLHRATRLDGTSSIIRMEEIQDPALGCEIACAVETRDAHRAGIGAITTSVPPQRAERPRPQRQAA